MPGLAVQLLIDRHRGGAGAVGDGIDGVGCAVVRGGPAGIDAVGSGLVTASGQVKMLLPVPAAWSGSCCHSSRAWWSIGRISPWRGLVGLSTMSVVGRPSGGSWCLRSRRCRWRSAPVADRAELGAPIVEDEVGSLDERGRQDQQAGQVRRVRSMGVGFVRVVVPFGAWMRRIITEARC